MHTTNSLIVYTVISLIQFPQRTDHEPIANTALKTKLKKDRTLFENVHIQAAISTELASNLLVLAPLGTPEAKVQSRLLSSKVLAIEVAAVIEDLKSILHLGNKGKSGEIENDNLPIDPSGRPKKIKKVAGVEQENIIGLGRDSDKPEQVGDSSEDEDADEENINDEASDWESGTVGDDDDTLGDGWESDDVIDNPVGPEDLTSSSNSQSESDDDAISRDKGLPVKSLNTQKKPAVPKGKPTSTGIHSTFLPSLSVGFTRGESDGSEWSDSEAKIADGDQKKNRRGQRARRAYVEVYFESLLITVFDYHNSLVYGRRSTVKMPTI